MKPVRIYTTTYCGFCVRAKDFLRNKGVPYEEIDVTGDDEARRDLVERTGRRTVPQIFIGEEPIGGYTDLVQLDRTGQLGALLGGQTGERGPADKPAAAPNLSKEKVRPNDATGDWNA